MAKEATTTEQEHQKQIVIHNRGGSNPMFGMGMIGAWVYYFKRATTTQERVQAFLKGFAWPAFLVYELLLFLEKK
jgi:hypothetical protein